MACLAAPGPRIVREDIEWLDVWLPNTNDHAIPRVLLIGDSITRSYGSAVEESLRGKAYVARLATSKSLGDPALLEQVALVLNEQKFDIIHFNNGLHGDGYSEAEYGAALPELISLLRRSAPDARLIWASTTDVRVANQLERVDPKATRVVKRNEIAAGIAKSQGIPIDDLFPLVSDHPEYHAPDGVHFNEKGVQVLARQVSSAVLRCLK